MEDIEVRCPKCNKLLLIVKNGLAQVEIKCTRCDLMVSWPVMAAEPIASNQVKRPKIIAETSDPSSRSK